MPKPVKITADTPCDIGAALTQRYNVELIPLHVTLGDTEYKDLIDIDLDTIYKYWDETGTLPKTSAVSVGEYLDVFRKYLHEGYEIVHIGLGSGLSVSCQNARLAAQELEGVYVVDSCSLSTGFGLLVCKAGEWVQEGLSAAEIAQRLEPLNQKTSASFVIDTLAFLRAGGRCSSLMQLGANLMSIKPSIQVVNSKGGSMIVGKKYMGKLHRCISKYMEDQLKDREDICRERVFITHSGGFSEEELEKMRQEVESFGPWGEICITRAGCTIGSHCGLGTVGVLFMTR